MTNYFIKNPPIHNNIDANRLLYYYPQNKRTLKIDTGGVLANKKTIFVTYNRTGCACLKTILKTGLADIVRVYTLEYNSKLSDYEDVAEICHRHSIPWKITRNINDQISSIRKLEPDLIFIIGWSQLIKKELIDIPRLGCIGFHPALLPKNRGRAAIPWHFINEEKQGGATFFYIDEGCDSGDIICQKSFPLNEGDNARTYYNKMLLAATAILEENLEKIVNGQVKRLKQNSQKANYLLIRTERDSFLNFETMTARQIFNQIRAVAYVYPTAYAFYENHKILIYEARLIPEKLDIYSATEGQVVKILSSSNMWVKARDRIIELINLRGENDEPVDCQKHFKVGHHFNR